MRQNAERLNFEPGAAEHDARLEQLARANAARFR